MAVTVAGLKDYLRNPPDNDDVLELYLNAAVEKANSAGIPQYTDNALYDLFIYSLASFYYDNRGLTFGGSYQATAEENARKLINSFVLELRYSGNKNGEGGASP